VRDLIRVTNLEVVDEFGAVVAIAELTISIGGQELRLRGLAVVRSGRDFRLSLPRYQNSKSTTRVPTWEPTSELRRAREAVVLQCRRESRSDESVAEVRK